MSSFSIPGTPSKQIVEQVQPVPRVWEFLAEALQGAGLAGNGRAAVSAGRQRERRRGENEGAVLDLKGWQLLRLAWVHRATDVSKAGAGGGRGDWGRAGGGSEKRRDLGQGGGSRRAEGYYVTEGGAGVMLVKVGQEMYWGWW